MNPKTHAAHPVAVESKYWGANLHIYIYIIKLVQGAGTQLQDHPPQQNPPT